MQWEGDDKSRYVCVCCGTYQGGSAGAGPVPPNIENQFGPYEVLLCCVQPELNECMGNTAGL